MFFPHNYLNKSNQFIEKDIKKAGFDPILIHDSSGFVYAPHSHPEIKLLAILEGEMKVKVANQKFQCTPGDKLIIPPNTVHSAIVGPLGCKFYWSEKIV